MESHKKLEPINSLLSRFFSQGILNEITQYLDTKSFINLRATCQFFRNNQTISDLLFKKIEDHLPMQILINKEPLPSLCVLKKNYKVMIYSISSWGPLKISDIEQFQDMNFPDDEKIIQMNCSGTHFHFCTAAGKVYSYDIKTKNMRNLFESLPDLKICQVVCSDQTILYLTKEGQVYGVGDNKYYSLGFNDGEIRIEPELVEGLRDLIITQIASSGRHSLFLTNEGRVYACGDNQKEQLGLPKKGFQRIPELIESLKNKKIIQVACASRSSFFLTEEEIYVCGNNDSNQLGLGEKCADSKLKILPKFTNDKIIKIICGRFSTYFLTARGQVWDCGDNSNGELGSEDIYDQPKPILLQALAKEEIVDITSGYTHTIYLSKAGTMFISGSNNFGNSRLFVNKEFNTIIRIPNNKIPLFWENNRNAEAFKGLSLQKANQEKMRLK